MKRLLVLVACLAFIGGCADMKVRDRVSRLEGAIDSYGGAIRWARYTDAYAFHHGKDGFRPPLDLESFEGIRVTAYNIQEKILSPEQTEATVTVKISYYNDNTGVVNDIRHIQNWWYKEEVRQWLVDAAFPKFE